MERPALFRAAQASIVSSGATLRCAIYTRTSGDEGLEQTFNSLDAQRESCEAFIRSQVALGWRYFEPAFADGGYSGGNLDRPALKRLLGCVDEGELDVIVVYKVDRLTRSLADFTRIMERLEAGRASFVSVTQAFNTATSMGKLMLNVLLSFAQFERDVTGERIRDKVAASKAKGIWMGGSPPLGYDIGDRKLVVNGKEAEIVRHFFARYVQLGSGLDLLTELRNKQITTKRWTSRSGRQHGGMPFSTSSLYYLLRNRLYVGETTHHGRSFPGEHEPLVELDLFEAAQVLLNQNQQQRTGRPRRRDRCHLLGLVFDTTGAAMTTSFSYGRKRQLYRYYLASSAVPGRPVRKEHSAPAVTRVPADQLEAFVLERAKALLGPTQMTSWSEVRRILERVELKDESIQLVLRNEEIVEPFEPIDAAQDRIARELPDERIVVDEAGALRVVCDCSPRFRGGRIWAPRPSSDHNRARLQDTVRSAHRLLEKHSCSALKPDTHSHARAARDQRSRRLMIVGLLAPSIQRALLEGQVATTPEQLLGGKLPLAWRDQLRLFNM